MEENRVDNKKNSMVSEFILPPMNEWEKEGAADENDATNFISQIKQKYKDQVLIEIYESGRILHAELANRIPISASGLNAVIKKINEFRIKAVRETKAGKFKFYTLTKEGLNYIENIVLPLLISSKQDEEAVHNLFHLIALYKDKNPETWVAGLSQIIKNKEEEKEIDTKGSGALGCELLEELGRFYQSDKEKAKRLLELGMAEKEIRNDILLYFEKEYGQNGAAAWTILNQWEKEECIAVYQMIDELFISIKEDDQPIQTEKYHLRDMESRMEAVLDKIKADILQAMVKQWPKKELMDLWVKGNMEVHLALYIAEKYQILNEYFVKKVINRES